LSPRLVSLLFAVALLSVFLTPITYLAHEVTSVEHHHLQTLLMRFGGGLVIPPIALAVLWSLWPVGPLAADKRPLRASLIASLVLFSAGGIIGFLITGSNVRIPAHYHGCIVGVTLAMMGVVYLLLPRFGYAAPSSRTAAWQPTIYGVGQMMHIVGLVWSGGYGVQRKVAGSDQVLRSTQETLGMGLMGLGGLIAIVGGVMFVVIVLRALRHPGTRLSMHPSPTGGLQTIGALGSMLALAILGASILLRLTTQFGLDGVPLSTLSSNYENSIRMVHRLAATSLGLLALAAAILCWMRRSSLPKAVQPVVWMVAATLLLALIGPLTPGYCYSAVTIANVVAGTVLLAACWWLRETLVAAPALARTWRPVIRVTLAIFLLHVALGAAASDFEMRGTHWVAFIHSGSAMLTTLLLGSILWDNRKNARSAKLVHAMAGLLTIQVALGLVSLWMAGRPVRLDFVHAMLSPLLLAGLVSLAERET
jgi:hypothetical protein